MTLKDSANLFPTATRRHRVRVDRTAASTTRDPDRETAPTPASIPWTQFAAELDFRQGEHVGLIGPTGCGKTTVANAVLLPRRRYTAVLATKPEDPVLDDLIEHRGYRRVERWSEVSDHDRRVIVWPAMPNLDDDLAEMFHETLNAIYREKRWCLYFDEAWDFCHALTTRRTRAKGWDLARDMRALLRKGRSIELTVVAGTQRPSGMPLEMYDQATHLFLWRDTDRVNLRRFGEIGGQVDTESVRRAVLQLDAEAHQFLYIDTRSGAMRVSAVGSSLH